VRVIAIDGPAGSGKSTVAAAVARRAGLACLHTGAMYRAATLGALRAGVDVSDAVGLDALVATLAIEVADRVRLDGEDVTDEIRTAPVAAAVSAVSAHAGVRRRLVERQRAWVRDHGGSVVEGRDIGTVVFPDADVKVYLTATPEVRAARRSEEAEESGEGGVDLAAVAERLARRDALDAGRAVSPLTVAADAHVIDSTTLDVDEVVEKVLALL
jgi:cytidylate kinase